MDETMPDFDRDAPALRTFAMPRDLNGNGDVFGGWVLSQMDVAGGVIAARRAQGRVATIGIEAMKFHRPVSLGDEVNCYCAVERVGTTSIRVKIDVWVRRGAASQAYKVTEGVFTYVAIGEDRRPRPVPPA
ncbi:MULTISPECIES: acyl-CoA thioesterase [Rhodospirillales]|uniref:Acyl-CoA thioester hydrolase, putative n=2 Tax=Rhodospirillales TaxID=204441 RepID=B6IMV8_RHOCS|nr:acyl-CoA thioesterase [Rhodospirillum centenum]ACI98774.1 acyl-CoA thioester hydrolase, putative [Rhodospirillum centenum SW]